MHQLCEVRRARGEGYLCGGGAQGDKDSSDKHGVVHVRRMSSSSLVETSASAISNHWRRFI